MKKIIYISVIALFFLLVSLIFVLSTIGFETDKFNKFISDKTLESNKNIALKLEKVKFKFDIKDFNLFLETKNPELVYKESKIPIQSVKVYLDFYSLIRSKSKIDKINVSSDEINIDQLKKIIVKTKPSNLNSFISNNVKNGKLVINLEMYFNDNFEIDNFIAKGKIEELDGIINNNIGIKNTSFNFFGDSSDILIKNVKSETDGLFINNGNLQIKKDDDISVKFDFTTEIKINKENITNYLSILKNTKFINQEFNLDGKFDNFLNITFDKTFKVVDYDYTNKGKINNSLLIFEEPIKSLFLENNIKNLYLKDTNLNLRFASDQKNYIYSSGTYSTDNKRFQNYDLKNDIFKEASDININFELTEKLKIDFINYNKDPDKVAEISLNVSTKNDQFNLKDFKYSENKNLISIQNLKIKKKDIISLKNIKIKTFEKNELKNDFILEFGKKIKISGNKYDAKNLNKFLSQKTDSNVLKKISKNIEIDLKNIDTPLSKKLKNFRLLGVIEKGKFIKISSKGDFGDNKFLDISMKNDKKTKRNI